MELQHQNFFMKENSWFFDKIKPNLDNQHLVANQMLSENLTELHYEEGTAFRKKE